MKQLIILIMASCLFLGCQRPSVNVEKPSNPVNTFVMTDSLKKVRLEFLKMEKADQDSVYKQFSGSALFLKNNKVLKSTDKFDPIFGRVQSDFGWNREKYPDFTTAVSEFLKEQGYEQPRMLDSETNRTWFYNIFYSISMSLKNE
jgi:hypothetical protein